MWLLAGRKAPDHSTIARFRTGFLADACEDLFYQMVLKRLQKAGELSKETVFIDGTKLEACANKYTFVWKKSVGKWETKMLRKIQEAVFLLNQEYIQSFSVTEETRTQDLQKICHFLEQIKNSIPFLSMAPADGKAGPEISGRCSAISWNVRRSMTGIHPASRDGIIIAQTDPDATLAYER